MACGGSGHSVTAAAQSRGPVAGKVSGRQLNLMRQSRAVMDLDEDPLKVVGQVGMMTARRRGWSMHLKVAQRRQQEVETKAGAPRPLRRRVERILQLQSRRSLRSSGVATTCWVWSPCGSGTQSSPRVQTSFHCRRACTLGNPRPVAVAPPRPVAAAAVCSIGTLT